MNLQSPRPHEDARSRVGTPFRGHTQECSLEGLLASKRLSYEREAPLM